MSKEIQVINKIKEFVACESCPLRLEAQRNIEKSSDLQNKVISGEKVYMGFCKHAEKLTLKGFLIGEEVTFVNFIASDAKIRTVEANGQFFKAPTFGTSVIGACPEVISQTVDRWFVKIGLGKE